MPRRSLDDVTNDLGTLIHYLAEPRTMDEMCEHLGGCSRWTIYRRLKEIEESGQVLTVGLSRPTRYHMPMVP